MQSGLQFPGVNRFLSDTFHDSDMLTVFVWLRALQQLEKEISWSHLQYFAPSSTWKHAQSLQIIALCCQMFSCAICAPW